MNALESKWCKCKYFCCVLPSSFFSTSPAASLHLAVLDVYVLSTDGQVQDFKFPQSSKSGISIQLSANTVKLNSRNGKYTHGKQTQADHKVLVLSEKKKK